MNPGESGILKGFSQEGPQQWRLMELGLLPGTPLKFIRRAPMGDPVEVEVRGYHLSLRTVDADNILMEKAS